MTPLRQQIEARIDAVLDGMLLAPQMYGPPDGVELQALLLLELRAFIARPEAETRHPRRVFEAWLRHLREGHLREGHPGASNTLLAAALLRLHSADVERQYGELATALADFRRELIGELTPDNPFATYDLALAVRMKKGKALPPAAKVGALYGLVGQVMRSVVRPNGGGRGKLSRDHEDAIAVRPAGGFEIVPENGVGAQIVMPFAWPTGAQGQLIAGESAEDTVRRTFARFVDVAAWASDGVEPVESLIQVVSEEATRTRMVLDAMRLVPSITGDIEAMELGGRAIQRELPVKLRAQAQGRLLGVLQHQQTPIAFSATGTLRMVDLDEGRVRLRMVDGDKKSSIEVWLGSGSAFDGLSAMLGRDVAIEGTRFAGERRAPFVVATRVNLIDSAEDAEDAEN
nr:hypothetical protein [Deltaproteobacteria bacterium]